MEKFYAYTVAACLISSLAIIGCTRNISKEISKDVTIQKNTSEEFTEIKPPARKTLSKKYLSEGFIGSDIFRVIILAPVEECDNGFTEIQYRAKKRAEASLQKFLISKDRIIDQNARAGILNLINNFGEFHAKDIHCEGNNVFYFDIQKNNLKRHLKKISQSRN